MTCDPGFTSLQMKVMLQISIVLKNCLTSTGFEPINLGYNNKIIHERSHCAWLLEVAGCWPGLPRIVVSKNELHP
jgi:hypothetical protein